MGIKEAITGLFKPRDAPQNRTSGSGYAFFMGGSTSGKYVNERTAMQMTAVYACVRILSEAIAGLPLHTSIGTTMMVGQRRPSTMYFTICSTMSRTLK